MDTQALIALLQFAQTEAPLVQQAVKTAEALFSAPGSGAEKLSFVLQILQQAASFQAAFVATPGGKAVATVAASIGNHILNLLGEVVSSVAAHLFPKKAPVPVPAT